MSKIFGKYLNEFEDLFFFEKNNTFDIYNAHNIKDNRDVTLKIMKKESYPDYVSLMKKLNYQKDILNKYKSENFLNLYRIFETENYVILEQEWYETNMHEYIMNNGPSSSQKEFFKEVAIELAKALQILYTNRIMHRMIKSSTVFLTMKKNKYSVKLGEFSKAIYFKDNVSECLNSYYYSAPEIINGEKYDEKCDIWSFGIVLYDLYFGDLPYGYKPSKNKIIRAISDESNFKLKKSGIPTLDQLFEETLRINPEQRLNHEELFSLVFSEQFMSTEKSDFTLLKKNSINSIDDLITKKDVIININEIDDSSLFDSVKSDINATKYNNILYYDEKVDHIHSLIRDCINFERETPGSFILCQNMESLKIIKEEILKEIKLYPRTKFNLITSGSSFDKIINFLTDNPEFEKCFRNYCIYCFNLKKYEHFKEKYKDKLKENIYSERKDIIQYIKNSSSSKIVPFHINKIITYNLYRTKDSIRKTEYLFMQFYGDIKKEQYQEYYNQFQEYISDPENLDQFKNDKNQLLNCLKNFDTNGSKLILRVFINILYTHLNKFLINNDLDLEKWVVFYISRIQENILILLNSEYYYKWETQQLYMGDNLSLSELLQFIRIKGIISFSKFLMFYEDKKLAEEISHRNDSINYYKTEQKFSVLFIINKDPEETHIYYGLNIEKFNDKNNKGVLIMPYRFFEFKKIEINLQEYTANIYLRTIL